MSYTSTTDKPVERGLPPVTSVSRASIAQAKSPGGFQSIRELAANFSSASSLNGQVEASCEKRLSSTGFDRSTASTIARRLSGLLGVLFMNADSNLAASKVKARDPMHLVSDGARLKSEALKVVTPDIVSLVSRFVRDGSSRVEREGLTIDVHAIGRGRLLAFAALIDRVSHSTMTDELQKAGFDEIAAALLSWSAQTDSSLQKTG